MLVWRRSGLYHASIHSMIAWGSCCLVSHRAVSSSSRCIVDQSDSIIVLSTEEATRPVDPSRHCSSRPSAMEAIMMTERIASAPPSGVSRK